MKTIYNNRFAVICYEPTTVSVPDYVDLYQGDLHEEYQKLKLHELLTHKLYNWVLVSDMINGIDFNILKRFNVNDNRAYCYEVTHSGFPPECSVDLRTVLCSSWTLPFIVSEGSDYAYLRKHRIKMLTLDNTPKSLI